MLLIAVLGASASASCVPRAHHVSRFTNEPDPEIPLGGAADFAQPRAQVFAAAQMALEIQNYRVVLASADQTRIVTGRRLLEVASKSGWNGSRTVAWYRQLDVTLRDLEGRTRVDVAVRQFAGDDDQTPYSAKNDPSFARAWTSLFDEMGKLLTAGSPAAPAQPSGPPTNEGGTRL